MIREICLNESIPNLTTLPKVTITYCLDHVIDHVTCFNHALFREDTSTFREVQDRMRQVIVPKKNEAVCDFREYVKEESLAKVNILIIY